VVEEVNQLRDKKTGQFVSTKDAGKKEVDLAIRIWSQEPESVEKDALGYCRSVWELIFILVLTIFVVVASVYVVVRI
jgi:hypothetical protein